MSLKEEKEIVSKIEDLSEEFRELLLVFPATWHFLISTWSKVKRAGKSTSRMSRLYGASGSRAEELSETVDAAMEVLSKGERSMMKKAALQQHLYFEAFENLPEALRNHPSYEKLKRLRSEIEENRERLVTANLRLVISFAQKYRTGDVPIMDLIQEGNLGLIRAAEKFDSSKKVKFSTYSSWWIRQGFIKALRRHNKPIRLPPHIFERMSKTAKAKAVLVRQLNREPRISEIALETGQSTSQTIYMLDLASALPTSLDVKVSDKISGASALRDFIPSEEPQPDALVEELEMKKRVRSALVVYLSEEEAVVLIDRFGLRGKVRTLAEIGSILGISREKARLLEESGLRKMRDRAGWLKDLLDE